MDLQASKNRIISLAPWFHTPTGAYAHAWEQARLDELTADIFGYNALQIGLPGFDTLAANRMPNRWVTDAVFPPDDSSVTTTRPVVVVHDFTELPFATQSLDLVVLPHVLEFAVEPHQVLREVERVLVPEGRVVISGLNPASLWGLRQRRAHFYRRLGYGKLFLPEAGEFIGYWRLRDWLRLLSFEVESGQFGCYRPAVSSRASLERFPWLDKMGERWWPIFGALYFLVAIKRVRGMRLLESNWKAQKATATAPAVIANQVQRPDSF